MQKTFAFCSAVRGSVRGEPGAVLLALPAPLPPPPHAWASTLEQPAGAINVPDDVNADTLGTVETLLSSLLKIQKKTNIPLWLCGGDSEIFYDQLKEFELDLHHVPDLGLEAMTKIKL